MQVTQQIDVVGDSEGNGDGNDFSLILDTQRGSSRPQTAIDGGVGVSVCVCLGCVQPALVCLMFSCKPDTHTRRQLGVGSQVNNLLSAHNQRDNNETQRATWHLDTTGQS